MALDLENLENIPLREVYAMSEHDLRRAFAGLQLRYKGLQGRHELVLAYNEDAARDKSRPTH